MILMSQALFYYTGNGLSNLYAPAWKEAGEVRPVLVMFLLMPYSIKEQI